MSEVSTEKSMFAATYRPHNPGHDYYAPGIYLITLVVRDRRVNSQMFGRLNDDLRHPDIVLSEAGKAVMACWSGVQAFEESKGRKVLVHAAACMPDHFHGVIEVKERMAVSLGQVIWGFKVACTKSWRQITGGQQPMTAADGRPSLVDQVPDLHRMSRKQRAAYYAQHPEAQQPLWDDNYDDTICLSDPLTGQYSERHLTAMLQYVNDNVRRAIVRRLYPHFFERCLHVRIDGRDYAAFGNLFLLRWTRKVQVFCHRLSRRGALSAEEWQKATASQHAIRSFEAHAREHKLGHYDRDWFCSSLPSCVTAIDYTRTASFRQEHEGWVAQVMAGQTVIVTPGISMGERLLKDECLAKGYPLIHLQKEPIGAYWKPEKVRFEACLRGSLLILAPWQPESLGSVGDVPASADYSVFHNLNRLAAEICAFGGEAMVCSGSHGR